MSEPNRWVLVKPVKGGQVVVCRLCGKRFRRTFMAAMTNYAEALRGAEEYAVEHEASGPHVAALDAYFSDDTPVLTDSERRISSIFGHAPPNETELRRRAARRAALNVR